MAGIDRRVAGGEQRQQRRLRPLQVEGDFEIALGGHVDHLVVPGLARVLAEFLRRLAHQHVERAFDVGRRERLAVMPLDAFPQLEGQRLVVGAPRPAGREIRADRLQAVLRDVLVVDDEVVEHRHERDIDRVGRAFMDRSAARTVSMIDPQDAALFRLGRACDRQSHHQGQRYDSKRPHAPHSNLPGFFRGLTRGRLTQRYHGGGCRQ